MVKKYKNKVKPKNESEWFPISVAPTDGSHYLVYNDRIGSVVEVAPFIKKDKWGEIIEIEWIDYHANSLKNVTHWMPLPEPPNGP